MSGDSKAKGPILVRKVDTQGRLQLLSDIQEHVPWLEKGGEYIASVGPVGGVRIEPRQGIEEREARLPTEPLEEEDVDSALADYRRYAAFRWNIKIEQAHWNFTLPKELRKLELAPDKRELAILYADGVLLEVWRQSAWLEYMRLIAKDRRRILEAALEEAP